MLLNFNDHTAVKISEDTIQKWAKCSTETEYRSSSTKNWIKSAIMNFERTKYEIN